MAAASVGVADSRLHLKPDEDVWSANDILAHLRACADVWGKSIQAMITQDHPTVRYVSPRTYMRKTDYPQLDFRQSLAAFTTQRTDLLALLDALEPESWSRGATFTGITREREQTVLSYAQRIASHETEHLDQIEGLLRQA
jgi:hypothetical protein